MQSDSLSISHDQTVTAPSDARAFLDKTEPNQDPADPTVQEHGYSYRGPPRDRLSTLPPELLAELFKLVRIEKGESEMSGAMSKSLLPYTDSNRYQKVTFTDVRRLELFMRTIKPEEADERLKNRAEHLASLVRDFTVIMIHNVFYRMAEWDSFDGLGLFGTLSQATRIEVVYCPPFINTLTSYACTSQCLPSMKVLDIAGITRASSTPFMMERFANLSLYPSLDNLKLTYHDDNGEMWRPEILVLPSLSILPPDFTMSIKSLELPVHVNATTSAGLATFVSHFSQLETFALADKTYDYKLQLDTILQAITTNLRHLEVWRDGNEGEALGIVLSRFINLETLKLSFNEYEDGLILALRACTSLKLLHFSPMIFDYLPFAAVNSLIFAEAPSPSLKELRIDGLFGHKEGESPGRSDLNSVCPEDYGWKLQRWKEGFTFEQASEMVAAASRIGIRITGSLAEAVQIEKKWNKGLEAIMRHMEEKDSTAKVVNGDGQRDDVA